MADKRQTIEKEIAELFKDVLEYRDSKKFEDLLHFCVKLNTLGSYNAMLVKMQCPEARYVLSRERWATYNRKLIVNARPLMILVPFGPVSFVFDISQTEHIEGKPLYEDEFFEELSDPYRAEGSVKPLDYDRFIDNLKYWSIDYTGINHTSNEFTASLKKGPHYKALEFWKWHRKYQIHFPLTYYLTVNKNLTMETQLVGFCHEMAHLLCQHIKAPEFPGQAQPAWEQRILSDQQCEFEAETVAWLITRRHGIEDSKSVEYLAKYVGSDGKIPYVSISHIMTAVDKIDQLFETIDIRRSWLYKNCDEFRSQVDDMYRDKPRWTLG